MSWVSITIHHHVHRLCLTSNLMQSTFHDVKEFVFLWSLYICTTSRQETDGSMTPPYFCIHVINIKKFLCFSLASAQSYEGTESNLAGVLQRSWIHFESTMTPVPLHHLISKFLKVVDFCFFDKQPSESFPQVCTVIT